MCILCVIQKWSRRIATMLPWLIIPLIGLWAFSQLLPPAFRFEITSPRLACVFVLLVTLFWYEILMPHLSSWRARRNARLRERKRVEAIELQKLRKTATKRCRNCLTPYKDQNPGGGRFMCSYCGHISKRPVLDIPLPPGLSNSTIKDLIGKSGKIMNGKLWPDSGWMHGQDWVESGNWRSGSAVVKSSYWRKNGNNVFGGDENCLAEKSYFCVIIFFCKLLNSFCMSIQWLWGKIFGFSSTREDFSSNSDSQGSMTKIENGLNFQESKGEKARRKAEEKRQARLEKELLEEEERKQREEVARLVKEQRRLRDEKMEAERDRSKTSLASLPVKEKDRKKESEKRRQERKKEKDRGSSRSNSDAEELEKRAGKENERKFDFDKKSEPDHRDVQKSFVEGPKVHAMEIGNGTKNNAASAPNFNGSNAGNRYLDRMRGSIWSSSKAFRGGSIFGKISSNATTVNKEEKSLSSIERVHTSNNRRDIGPPPERTPVKHSLHIDDKSVNSPVLTSQQPRTSPKKSWQQLFTRSLPVPPTPNVSVISRPTPKPQIEVCSPPQHGQSTSLAFENPTNFGIPAPFTPSTYPNPSPCSSLGSLGFSPAIEPIFSHVGENPHEFMAEEPELFEDPCYIPDPVSLLGPVSESLENFQLDKGTGFGLEIGGSRPVALKNAHVSTEVNKPSPIESPLSREKHNPSYQFRSLSKAQDLQTLPLDDVNTGAKEKGTWQMWKSSPLGQDGLGLVGSPASWLLPLDCNRTIKDDFVQPLSQKTMASLFKKDDQALSGTLTHHNVLVGNCHGDGTFSSVTGFRNDPWLQKGVFPPFSNTENHYAFKPQEETTHNDIIYGSPRTSGANNPFEPSQAKCWSKTEQTQQSSGEGAGKTSVLRPSVGGLFPNSDLESPWSFD